MRLGLFGVDVRRAAGVVEDEGASIRLIDGGAVSCLYALIGCDDLDGRVRSATPVAANGVRVLAPFPRPQRNIICVGKNYREHADEFARSGFDTSSQGGERDSRASNTVYQGSHIGDRPGRPDPLARKNHRQSRLRGRAGGDHPEARTGHSQRSGPHIIEVASRGITLQAGDIIATGTPSGVGIGRVPPAFLKPGVLIEIDIPEIGTLRNRVAAF